QRQYLPAHAGRSGLGLWLRSVRPGTEVGLSLMGAGGGSDPPAGTGFSRGSCLVVLLGGGAGHGAVWPDRNSYCAGPAARVKLRAVDAACCLGGGKALVWRCVNGWRCPCGVFWFTRQINNYLEIYKVHSSITSPAVAVDATHNQ